MLRIVIDVIERLWDDSNKQVEHDNVHDKQDKAEYEPHYCRRDAVIIRVCSCITNSQGEGEGISLGPILAIEDAFLCWRLWETLEGFVEGNDHSQENQKEDFHVSDTSDDDLYKVAYEIK